MNELQAGAAQLRRPPPATGIQQQHCAPASFPPPAAACSVGCEGLAPMLCLLWPRARPQQCSWGAVPLQAAQRAVQLCSPPKMASHLWPHPSRGSQPCCTQMFPVLCYRVLAPEWASNQLLSLNSARSDGQSCASAVRLAVSSALPCQNCPVWGHPWLSGLVVLSLVCACPSMWCARYSLIAAVHTQNLEQHGLLLRCG